MSACFLAYLNKINLVSNGYFLIACFSAPFFGYLYFLSHYYLTYVMEKMKDLGPFPEKEAILELLPWSSSLPADCHSKLKK